MGQDGCSGPVSAAIKIPSRNWKILFVLGSYEFLERLEGKTTEGPFFKGSIWLNNSVLSEKLNSKRIPKPFVFYNNFLPLFRRWENEKRVMTHLNYQLLD